METRILVADDSATICKMVTIAFENEKGVVVEGAADGAAAFGKLAAFKPDIVLADTDMPGMNGYDLSLKIKDSGQFGAVKVVLLTSDFEDFDADRFSRSKADGYLSKPFKSEEVVRRVREVMGGASIPAPVAEEPPALVLDVLNIVPGDAPIALDSAAIVTEEPAPALELSLDSVVGDVPIALDSAAIVAEEPAPALELSLDSVVGEAPIALDSAAIVAEEPAPALELALEGMVEDTAPVLEISSPVVAVSEESSAELTLLEPDDVEMERPPAAPELAPESRPAAREDEMAIDEFIVVPGADEDEDLPGASVAPAVVDDADFAEEPSPPGALDTLIEGLDRITTPEEIASLPRRETESVTELDKTLQELKTQHQEYARRPATVEAEEEEGNIILDPRLLKLRKIMPEPEDLLQRLAPHAFAPRGKEEEAESAGAPLIPPSAWSEPEPAAREIPEDKVAAAVGEQVRQLVEQALPGAIEAEMAGLSEAILQSIRETVEQVVREVTPGIVREVIREEIEQLRNS